MKKSLKKEEPITMLKIISLMENIYLLQNISHEFRYKNVGELKNYFLEEREQNELMSRKRKKVCTIQIILNSFLF